MHSMLRLDTTPQKRWMGFDFKLRKFSIKQAIFIIEILFSSVKVHKQKKIKFFSLDFPPLLLNFGEEFSFNHALFWCHWLPMDENYFLGWSLDMTSTCLEHKTRIA